VGEAQEAGDGDEELDQEQEELVEELRELFESGNIAQEEYDEALSGLGV
jgi:hypothetical protein